MFRCLWWVMGGYGLIGLIGCASHSTEMAKQLDRSKPEYQSPACQQTLGEVWIHQDIKNTTTIATPVVALSAGPISAIPLLLMHAVLGAADRIDASTLAQRCGAPAPGVVEIGAGVAADAALSVLGAGAGSAVSKVLPTGTTPLPAK